MFSTNLRSFGSVWIASVGILSTFLLSPSHAALFNGPCPGIYECGGLIFPQYTMCDLKSNKDDCYSYPNRKLKQGLKCGPCPVCSQQDMCSTPGSSLTKYYVCNADTRDLQCVLLPLTYTVRGYKCGLCPSAAPTPGPTPPPPTERPSQFPTPLPTAPTTSQPTPQPSPSPTVAPAPYQGIPFPSGCTSQSATINGRQTCTTVGAPSTSIPLCDGSGSDPSSNTVQFLFKTPYSNTRNVRAGTCSTLLAQTNFDTIVSVFEILSGGSQMKCIGRNDDSGVCAPQSRLTFAAEPGKQYAIYVYGKSGALGTFTFIVEDA